MLSTVRSMCSHHSVYMTVEAQLHVMGLGCASAVNRYRLCKSETERLFQHESIPQRSLTDLSAAHWLQAACLPVWLSACLSACLSVFLPAGSIHPPASSTPSSISVTTCGLICLQPAASLYSSWHLFYFSSQFLCLTLLVGWKPFVSKYRSTMSST